MNGSDYPDDPQDPGSVDPDPVEPWVPPPPPPPRWKKNLLIGSGVLILAGGLFAGTLVYQKAVRWFFGSKPDEESVFQTLDSKARQKHPSLVWYEYHPEKCSIRMDGDERLLASATVSYATTEPLFISTSADDAIEDAGLDSGDFSSLMSDPGFQRNVAKDERRYSPLLLKQSMAKGGRMRFEALLEYAWGGDAWVFRNMNLRPAYKLPEEGEKPRRAYTPNYVVMGSDEAAAAMEAAARNRREFAQEFRKRVSPSRGFPPGNVSIKKSPSTIRDSDKLDLGFFPEMQSRRISPGDLEGWAKDKIQNAINEMFARHGAYFEDDSIRSVFEVFSWYHPDRDLTFDRIESEKFSDIEKANLKTLAAARSGSVTTSSPQRQQPQKWFQGTFENKGRDRIKGNTVFYTITLQISGNTVTATELRQGAPVMGRPDIRLHIVYTSRILESGASSFTCVVEDMRVVSNQPRGFWNVISHKGKKSSYVKTAKGLRPKISGSEEFTRK